MHYRRVRWQYIFAILVFLSFSAALVVLAVNNQLRDLNVKPTSANAVVCPVNYDVNNESAVVVGCDSAGCGGFVEWCGLGNGSYSFTLELAGDYNLATEYLMLNFSGTEHILTASAECGELEEVFATTVTPVGGVVRMDYANSNEVGSVCDADYGSVLRAVLKPL